MRHHRVFINCHCLFITHERSKDEHSNGRKRVNTDSGALTKIAEISSAYGVE